jgi:hypothetical protein
MIQDFVEERRAFLELRQEEEKTRRSLLYRALGLIGLQPVYSAILAFSS